MKRVITILILLICTPTFGQDTIKTYKTFSSEQFEVNDIILAPKIYFELSGPFIKAGHIDSVKLVADFLIANPTINIEVSTHNDFRGSAEGNLRLSEKRAQCIKNVLIEHFEIQPDRVVSKGSGELEPIVSEKEILVAPTQEEKEKLHAINRRTEIKILKI